MVSLHALPFDKTEFDYCQLGSACFAYWCDTLHTGGPGKSLPETLSGILGNFSVPRCSHRMSQMLIGYFDHSFVYVLIWFIWTISWFDHRQFPVLNILQPPCNFSEECQLPMNASDFSAMSESGRGRMRPSIGAQMRRGGNKQTFLLSRTI